MKKRGFGEGKCNGFGGKLIAGETIIDSAKRETKEESQITIREMQLIGILTFEYLGKDKTFEVHIFKINKFGGRPFESEEMKPQWFDIKDIPFPLMWSTTKFGCHYF